MSSQAGNNLIRTARHTRFHHTNDCIYLFGCSAVAAVYLEADFTSSTRGLSSLVTVFPNKTDSIQHECDLEIQIVTPVPPGGLSIALITGNFGGHILSVHIFTACSVMGQPYHLLSRHLSVLISASSPRKQPGWKMTSQKHLFILTTFRLQSLLLLFSVDIYLQLHKRVV